MKETGYDPCMEDINWRLFVSALGLAFILEGVPYFLFAERMPLVLRMLSERPPRALRLIGGFAILAGLSLLFMIRHG